MSKKKSEFERWVVEQSLAAEMIAQRILLRILIEEIVELRPFKESMTREAAVKLLKNEATIRADRYLTECRADDPSNFPPDLPMFLKSMMDVVMEGDDGEKRPVIGGESVFGSDCARTEPAAHD
jgi:hypothetical protein